MNDLGFLRFSHGVASMISLKVVANLQSLCGLISQTSCGGAPTTRWRPMRETAGTNPRLQLICPRCVR